MIKDVDTVFLFWNLYLKLWYVN
uniref:Uncharacterized protein n=1 Tax=Rhizophora mucronata TaxID=61149 RepID=A0A2P2PSV8_RHIMU